MSSFLHFIAFRGTFVSPLHECWKLGLLCLNFGRYSVIFISYFLVDVFLTLCGFSSLVGWAVGNLVPSAAMFKLDCVEFSTQLICVQVLAWASFGMCLF